MYIREIENVTHVNGRRSICVSPVNKCKKKTTKIKNVVTIKLKIKSKHRKQEKKK